MIGGCQRDLRVNGKSSQGPKLNYFSKKIDNIVLDFNPEYKICIYKTTLI